MTCHLGHRYSHLQPLIYSFSNFYEQKTPLLIQKRGFEYPIKSPSIILKGESNQVNELQIPLSMEKISLKFKKIKRKITEESFHFWKALKERPSSFPYKSGVCSLLKYFVTKSKGMIVEMIIIEEKAAALPRSSLMIP